MKTYAVYDITGLITKKLTLPEGSIAANLTEGELWLEIVSDFQLETHYVLNGALHPRPVMALSISATTVPVDTEISIGNIPDDTEVVYPGGVEIVDDGFIEWESGVPGTFIFTLTKFPYQTEVVYAEVTEA